MIFRFLEPSRGPRNVPVVNILGKKGNHNNNELEVLLGICDELSDHIISKDV